MPILNRVFVVGILLLLASPVFADEIFSLKVGHQTLTPKGSFAVDGMGLSGTRVDVEEHLNYDDSEDLFAEAAVQLGDFRLSAAYLPIGFSGSALLDQTLIFDGVSFDSGNRIASTTDIDLYDVALCWYLLNVDDLPARLQIGPELSVKLIDATVAMREPATATTRDDSLQGALATVGLRAKIGLADFLSISGRVGYFGYGGNTFLDTDAQVEFSPLPMVGLFAGFRLLELDIDESGVVIDTTLEGPYLGAMIRF